MLTIALAAGLSTRAVAADPEHAPAGGKTEKAHDAHEKPNAMHHVVDNPHWEFFTTFDTKWHLPKIFGFQITRFMLLELIAAGLVLGIYIPLGRRLEDGRPPRGPWDNAFESLLTFIRNEVARPSLGEHDAERFLPFLWTLFLFILFNNLLGMFPFGGSATASIYVTGGLALCVFFAIHGSAIAKMGALHYLKTLWPHADMPVALAVVFKPLIFVIEVVGILVRNAVLAVRLFANMFAGHMVLATILLFVIVAARTAFALWAAITVASVIGVVLLSLLEIFVAFLQAYIFVFLTALFMGMALHPEH
jgi:F-type H+-transporting ATPase subunit a